MPGNRNRRGAVRKPGSKKGPLVGSGGKGRRALEGKGPTPKAEDRPYHPAAKRKAAAQRREQSRPSHPRKTDQSAATYVVGRNPVLEALRAQVPAQRLEVAFGVDTDSRIREAMDLAGVAGVLVTQVARSELDQRTAGAHHQGIGLRVAPYQYATAQELLRRANDLPGVPLIVALDGVTDPHNLGAVLRSAAAFGAHGVLIPERRSAAMGATAWKVSAGAAARLPVARVPNLVRALEMYKAEGWFVIGLDAAGTADAAALDLATGPAVVVVGSEGQGLARLTAKVCDLTASIPMDGSTESLNAAVAAGIVLYEVSKQRRQRLA